MSCCTSAHSPPAVRLADVLLCLPLPLHLRPTFLLQVSRIGLPLTFSLAAALLAFAGLCCRSLCQLTLAAPLLKTHQRREPRLQQQHSHVAVGHAPQPQPEAAAASGVPLLPLPARLRSPTAAAAAAMLAQQQQRQLQNGLGSSSSSSAAGR